MKKLRVTTIILLFFNFVSGLFGGLCLIIDPSGKMIQMPIAWLAPTPFTTFLIPGIILLIFIGLFSLVVAIFTMIKSKFYPYLIVLESIILFIWLTVEIIMLKLFYPPMHVPYYLIALCLFVTGLILNKKRLANKTSLL